ncbi:MAG: NAD(P)/FAD-dependent oxidoreductase [Nitrospirae bacterium]|nr:NAD(P)/FAD-dependent oxidoreductase [Nitrospirota bacterium]
MKAEFDVIIVGGGINGLACGCYLQKAGLEVAVFEKRNECGPFALTEDIFGGGVPVDTHAGVCFVVMSPAWADLELEKFGLDLIIPKVPAGTVWKDGKNLLFSTDPARTYEAFARFSKKDAETFFRAAGSIIPQAPEILERGVFSSPSEENLDFLWGMGKHVGFSPKDLKTMNGFELFDLMYESDYVRMSCMGGSAIGVFGDPAEKGEGVIMSLLGFTLAFGVPRGGMHNLVHSLVRCFRTHGGSLFYNAPVERVEFENGTPRRVHLNDAAPYPTREFRARQAVVMHVSPPLAKEMLGKDAIAPKDPELWGKMEDWDMTGHCAFTSYVLLKSRPRWASESWDPDVNQCAFPLRAWDSWDHAKRSFQYAKNEELFSVAGDVGEMYNLSSVDPTRVSPEGRTVVVYEVEYPMNLRRYGGIQAWDNRELTDRLHQSHMDDLGALISGFKDQLLAHTYYTPIDNWRRNPSAIYGHELGGDVSGGQWYFGRIPARSKIPGLYFSQGIWPASLTHLGNGYVAACSVAEDLGVRKRDWWTHRPLDYFAGKGFLTGGF